MLKFVVVIPLFFENIYKLLNWNYTTGIKKNTYKYVYMNADNNYFEKYQPDTHIYKSQFYK